MPPTRSPLSPIPAFQHAFFPSFTPTHSHLSPRHAISFTRRLPSRLSPSPLQTVPFSTRITCTTTPPIPKQSVPQPPSSLKHLPMSLSLASVTCALLKNIAGYFPSSIPEIQLIIMSSLYIFEFLTIVILSAIALHKLRQSGASAKLAVVTSLCAAVFMWIGNFTLMSVWDEFSSSGLLSQLVRLVASGLISVLCLVPLGRKLAASWQVESNEKRYGKLEIAMAITLGLLSLFFTLGNLIDYFTLAAMGMHLEGMIQVPKEYAMRISMEDFTNRINSMRVVRLVQKFFLLFTTLFLGLFKRVTPSNSVLMYTIQILLTAWLNTCISPKVHIVW